MDNKHAGDLLCESLRQIKTGEKEKVM